MCLSKFDLCSNKILKRGVLGIVHMYMILGDTIHMEMAVEFQIRLVYMGEMPNQH